jgi:hypothetical protein
MGARHTHGTWARGLKGARTFMGMDRLEVDGRFQVLALVFMGVWLGLSQGIGCWVCFIAQLAVGEDTPLGEFASVVLAGAAAGVDRRGPAVTTLPVRGERGEVIEALLLPWLLPWLLPCWNLNGIFGGQSCDPPPGHSYDPIQAEDDDVGSGCPGGGNPDNSQGLKGLDTALGGGTAYAQTIGDCLIAGIAAVPGIAVDLQDVEGMFQGLRQIGLQDATNTSYGGHGELGLACTPSMRMPGVTP